MAEGAREMHVAGQKAKSVRIVGPIREQRRRIYLGEGGVAEPSDDISSSIPRESVAKLILAIGGKQLLDENQKVTLSKLSKDLGISEAILNTFLCTLAERNVTLERQEQRLCEIVEDLRRVEAQLAPSDDDPPAVTELKDKAKAAFRTGEFGELDLLLAEGLAAQGASEEMAALYRACALSQRGGLALTKLHYRDAAEHFAAAARCVPSNSEAQILKLLSREANALYRQGIPFRFNLTRNCSSPTSAIRE